jgi:hypothetical protein
MMGKLAVWTHLSASKGSSKQIKYGSFRPSFALFRGAARDSGSIVVVAASLRNCGVIGSEGDMF